MSKLPTDYFLQTDVVKLAEDLLGKVILTKRKGIITSGIISETEAYAGIIDKASHAFGNRHTDRTAVMYKSGGIAYVYLCYGIHHLFNFVTNIEGIPHAILLRGIIPVEGIQPMEKRRKMKLKSKGFTDGPGKVSMALGISVKDNATDLQGNSIWVEDRGVRIRKEDVIVGPRIGVDYAGEAASWPYRFLIKHPERYQ